MTIFSNLLAIVLVSFILVLLFSALAKALTPRRDDKADRAAGGFFIFFLIVFFATWATSIWVQPIGPVFAGVYFLPIIFIALFFILAISAMDSGAYRRPPHDSGEQIKEKEATGAVINIFFWIFLFLILVSIVSRYTWIQ